MEEGSGPTGLRKDPTPQTIREIRHFPCPTPPPRHYFLRIIILGTAPRGCSQPSATATTAARTPRPPVRDPPVRDPPVHAPAVHAPAVRDPPTATRYAHSATPAWQDRSAMT